MAAIFQGKSIISIAATMRVGLIQVLGNSGGSQVSGKKKAAQLKRYGYCKLTHRPGLFVDSHIIPESLTRPSEKGAPLFQYGSGPRPNRRWTSWYDPELVIREGEDYLSVLDTWGVGVLREHKLVWSGWGADKDLGSLHSKFSEFLGIRKVELDTRRLRLFLLSLLWRAAASNLKEFRDVTLPEADLELLRKTILGLEYPSLSFYPVQLTQLSSKGVIHNQTPYPDIKYVPDIENPENPPFEMPTIRFYFDGLIAHFHTKLPLTYDVSKIGNLIVGAAPTLVLSTVAFEDSMQAREMLTVLHQYHLEGQA